MNTLPEILDMDLEDLTRLHLRREDRSGVLGFYVSALRHYLEGDQEALKATLNRVSEVKATDKEKKLLSLVFQARSEVRNLKVSDSTLEKLGKVLGDCGQWRGEVLFVLALCHEAREETQLMSRAYQEAAIALEDLGAKKKSVKALLNHVAAENLLHPRKKFLKDYQFIYSRAKKVKNFPTAAMALLNISHEYHDIGALRLALSHVNRAIALLEKQKQGRSYFLAVSHRAFVLHDLGRKEEGRLDYEALLASPFGELAGVRQTLDTIYGETDQEPKGSMPAPWRTKVHELKVVRDKLGPMEQRLLSYVAEGPKEKMDIIDYLYGTKLSPEVLERRFHNTIARIKKKCPGVILFEKGSYCLSPELFALSGGKKR